jgi:hypothetical protein
VEHTSERLLGISALRDRALRDIRPDR